LEQGWVQGANVKYHGDDKWSYCLTGAIHKVIGKTQYLLYNRILKKFLPEGYDNLVEFNDTPGRTLAEVLAVVDRAIVYYKKWYVFW
jgi:hypothetical protein